MTILPASRPFARVFAFSILLQACAGPQHHHGQVVAPTPSLPDALSDDPTDPALDEGDPNEPVLGAGQWLDQAFSLWHDEHYAACIAALREALNTQELNDAGQAMAYWHIYLSEQAMGHPSAAKNALADFVAVADAMVADGAMGLPDTAEARAFREKFDLNGRLARARATLNLAWAKQVHHAGRSQAYPLLVFDEVEMAHFLELVPPCGPGHHRRVVSQERRADPLGRPLAKVTMRCHHAPKDLHYFFAFIGAASRNKAVHGATAAQSSQADDLPMADGPSPDAP